MVSRAKQNSSSNSWTCQRQGHGPGRQSMSLHRMPECPDAQTVTQTTAPHRPFLGHRKHTCEWKDEDGCRFQGRFCTSQAAVRSRGWWPRMNRAPQLETPYKDSSFHGHLNLPGSQMVWEGLGESLPPEDHHTGTRAKPLPSRVGHGELPFGQDLPLGAG